MKEGLARALEIVQAEIDRAEALMNVESEAGPVFDRAQMDAGICALRTVAEAIREEVRRSDVRHPTNGKPQG